MKRTKEWRLAQDARVLKKHEQTAKIINYNMPTELGRFKKHKPSVKCGSSLCFICNYIKWFKIKTHNEEIKNLDSKEQIKEYKKGNEE